MLCIEHKVTLCSLKYLTEKDIDEIMDCVGDKSHFRGWLAELWQKNVCTYKRNAFIFHI